MVFSVTTPSVRKSLWMSSFSGVALGPDTEVAVGDEVVLIGAQGEERILAEEVARRLGTINYEVTTGLLPRVTRDHRTT